MKQPTGQDEALADLTPDECESLWDAFEKLDHAAAQVVYGDGRAKKAKDLKELLKKASQDYRKLRDKIEEHRKDRAPNGPSGGFKPDVVTVIEVTGYGLSVREIVCRLETGEHVVLTYPPEALVHLHAAIQSGELRRREMIHKQNPVAINETGVPHGVAR